MKLNYFPETDSLYVRELACLAEAKRRRVTSHTPLAAQPKYDGDEFQPQRFLL